MRTSRLKILLIGIIGLALLVLAACQPQVVEVPVTVEVTREVPVTTVVTQEVPVEVLVTPEPPHVFDNAFHVTTAGMAYWYSAENGGFETLTGVPYSDLSCKNCHVETSGCNSCHVSQNMAAPPQSTCLACHGRQAAEIGNEAVQDVHRAAGMTCVNCHSMEETHGDGQDHNSLWDTPPANTCTDCHQPSTEVQAHQIHMEKVDCSACHVRNVVNCYNCHFDTEVREGRKVANQRMFDLRLLVQRDGKVHLGNFMSMVYQDHSFVAIAPFYSHAVQRPDPATICAECHQNAFVQEYAETGKITVTSWDEAQQKVVHTGGVLPVPPDYQEALQFAFVTQDENGNWVFLRDTTELMQMLFAEPLAEMPPQFP